MCRPRPPTHANGSRGMVPLRFCAGVDMEADAGTHLLTSLDGNTQLLEWSSAQMKCKHDPGGHVQQCVPSQPPEVPLLFFLFLHSTKCKDPILGLPSNALSIWTVPSCLSSEHIDDMYTCHICAYIHPTCFMSFFSM